MGKEHSALFLVGLWRLEDGFVDVRVEFFRLCGGVEALEAVLLEGLHEDGLSHLQAVMERDKILVFGDQLVGRNGGEGAIEVIYRLNQILSESL